MATSQKNPTTKKPSDKTSDDKVKKSKRTTTSAKTRTSYHQRVKAVFTEDDAKMLLKGTVLGAQEHARARQEADQLRTHSQQTNFQNFQTRQFVNAAFSMNDPTQPAHDPANFTHNPSLFAINAMSTRNDPNFFANDAVHSGSNGNPFEMDPSLSANGSTLSTDTSNIFDNEATFGDLEQYLDWSGELWKDLDSSQ